MKAIARGSRVGRSMAANQSGAGLIELLVSLVLVGIVLVAMFGTYLRTQHTAESMTGSVESIQTGRAALQLLERDLRMAGSGWGRTQVDGALSGAPLVLRGVNPGYTGGAFADSVSILGAWDATTTLRSSMPASSSIIPCTSTSGIVAGDFVVVSNGASSHLFRVTAVTSPSNLQHDPASPYNAPGGHAGWPVGGYGAGARVLKTSWITYRVDSVQFGRPSLVREPRGGNAELVVPDLQSFEVYYRLMDGTETRNPINHSMIDRIVPVVKARGKQSASVDSAWAVIRPRAYS